MKKIFFGSIICTLFLVLSSCNIAGDYPEDIFSATALNSNATAATFDRIFNEIRAQKEANNLLVPKGKSYAKAATVQEYIEATYKSQFKQYIENVEKLNPGDDEKAKQMIVLSKDLFQYADKVYTEDFLKIAKMIDGDLPKEMVDAEIAQLDSTKGIEIDKKREKLVNIALEYAKEHNIKVNTYNNYPTPIQ